MKFIYKKQSFQTDAVKAVANVFTGQGISQSTRYRRDINTYLSGQNYQTSLPRENPYDFDPLDDTGYKNRDIVLTEQQLLENINKIQGENNIKPSSSLSDDLGRCCLDVEMETGTGKTYVYINTIFELNKRYGWSKFIVVVPSIAIREGVYKTFADTSDHFMQFYGKKARFFVYDSKNLTRLDNFSRSAGINVMIINTQAFATSLKEDGKTKEARIIYSKRDEFGSRRPIDVIAANRPILIMDEPQKMGGEVTRKALRSFHPLFTLYYSATHKTHHNTVYVLDALDAYNKKLVKKIEVNGVELKNLTGTDSYVYVERILPQGSNPPKAKIEFEINYSTSAKRETRILKKDDNLYYLSNNLNRYKGYAISDIDLSDDSVTFTNGIKIKAGQGIGNMADTERNLVRIQIRETILSHFEKEEKLFDRGIKTLSLFFLEKVSNYRSYDRDGNEIPGPYADIFEQEYESILEDTINGLKERNKSDSPYFKYLLSNCSDPRIVHNGYFSIDKKTGRSIDSARKRGSDFSDDISAYDLILKNKERLLSFEEPTRFIFSHSALREGWDNPNVFQICTLRHTDSAIARRQEVGRGLRLCVNQDGDRMDRQALGNRDLVQEINKLTVIANEDYGTFVSALQSEIKEVLYDRPREVTSEYFVGKTVIAEGNPVRIEKEQADRIEFYLIKSGYIDEKRKVTDLYRKDSERGTLKHLPEDLRPMSRGIHALVQSVYDEKVLDSMFSDGHAAKVENSLNDNFYKKEFQELWSEINHKYVYTASFDSEELIKKATDSINDNLIVRELRYTSSIGQQKSDMTQDDIRRGDSFTRRSVKTRTLAHSAVSTVKYDLVGRIATGAVITRKTAARILRSIAPEKLEMFRYNPEEFIKKVTRLISEQKATMVVEHITYNRIEGHYESDIFTEERKSFGAGVPFESKKAIQNYIFTDGTASDSVERRFARDLEDACEVSVYAKLPKSFQIPTPVGNYSPDWAIAFYEGKVKHIFFIAETKGSMNSLELRPKEQAKISCAKKLFNGMSNGKVKYHNVDSYETLLRVMKTL